MRRFYCCSFCYNNNYYAGQQNSKHFCICDEYVINLFVCICEVRKWHKKLLGSSFKIMLPL